jgi:hypothetical protein
MPTYVNFHYNGYVTVASYSLLQAELYFTRVVTKEVMSHVKE